MEFVGVEGPKSQQAEFGVKLDNHKVKESSQLTR